MNVYVVVCVLLTAGLHEPVIGEPVNEELLVELVGSENAVPAHIGPGLVKYGISLLTTVTFTLAVAGQPPRGILKPSRLPELYLTPPFATIAL